MDYSKLTLGELLSSKDQTIRRNAISILKVFQKTHGAIVVDMSRRENWNWECTNCGDTGTYWTMDDVAEKGTPICNVCGEDMSHIAGK